MNKKEILYVDMDGVIADFDAGIKIYDANLETSDRFANYEEREDRVDEIVRANPTIFENLPLIEGAVEAVKELSQHFEIYFLSTPMENIPESFMGKKIWLNKHFGNLAYKNLILTHRKDLNIGAYLIDDRLKNGVEGFTGEHIHFGTEKFPNWESVLKYLNKKRHVSKSK